jgi:hypothetical protein
MKKLFYLTAMAFFFAMSVSFSPPDGEPDNPSPDFDYVIDADQNAEVVDSFVFVMEISPEVTYSESIEMADLKNGTISIPALRPMIPNPNIYANDDIGDGTSEDSNYNSNHEVRSDRPIDPGWCSSK